MNQDAWLENWKFFKELTTQYYRQSLSNYEDLNGKKFYFKKDSDKKEKIKNHGIAFKTNSMDGNLRKPPNNQIN